MERLVITIRPSPTDQGLLSVSDAMQQVVDLIRIHEEVARAIASPEEAFEWKLEHASASSPLTVTALAQPLNPRIDVSEQVQRVKAQAKIGLRDLIQDGSPPWWMGPDVLRVARSVFSRTTNGIGITEIEYAPTEKLTIDRASASTAINAIAGITAIDAEVIGDREAFGEIQGQLIAAGTYYRRPAILIRTEQYGDVWCPLSQQWIERFGTEHKIEDVWGGQMLGVQGGLIYGKGGKLVRIEVSDIREITEAPPIDMDAVFDPNFTAGLDPVEYLRQFHEGELA